VSSWVAAEIVRVKFEKLEQVGVFRWHYYKIYHEAAPLASGWED
jgi:hypothetical protein